MRMVDIIACKRDGKALGDQEIAYFVKGVSQGTVSDEQIAALLMAIRIRGMDARETAQLSLQMAQSGTVADLSAIPGIKVDKHSTGGVGDTTTLICLPLAAACGVPVAKMSGRSLGHTGGTLDKLWSIPGMRTELSVEEMIAQVQRIGCALAGQTGDLAPADKKLYALRDVTATVDSLPLIASSILSKKIAAGCQAILLDVKAGSGALMEREEDARALARAMVEIGTHAGRRMVAVVSDMSQPLGSHIGNALEVREAVDILNNRAAGPLREMSLLLAAHMVLLAGLAPNLAKAGEMVERALTGGDGAKKMQEWISAQGGDDRIVQDVSHLPAAAIQTAIPAPQSGYIQSIRCDSIGIAAQLLGAGRARKEDDIDYAVGLVMHGRVGDYIKAGEPLVTLHANDRENIAPARQTVLDAIAIGAQRLEPAPLVLETITSREDA